MQSSFYRFTNLASKIKPIENPLVRKLRNQTGQLGGSIFGKNESSYDSSKLNTSMKNERFFNQMKTKYSLIEHGNQNNNDDSFGGLSQKLRN